PEEQMLGSPTDPRTLHLLATELVEVAALVPVVAPAPLPEPESGPEVAPPPRPANPSGIKPPEPGLEWQALRPVAELERYVLPEPKVGPDPRLREMEVWRKMRTARSNRATGRRSSAPERRQYLRRTGIA